MLMDELVQKGWGLGSGISLFIMAGVAQNILWSTFSPSTGLFVGALCNYLKRRHNHAFTWVFGSASGVYPSLIGFIATIVVFLVVIYLQGVRIELPMSYAGYKGFRSRYPIKLLYVSNLPVIFASCTIRQRVLLQPTPLEPTGKTCTRHEPVLPNHRRLQHTTATSG